MSKIFSLLTVLVITLFSLDSLAWTPPPTPKPASAISDQGHVLPAGAQGRLDAKLTAIKASSANEIAALILPSLEGADIADVGISTAKAWGIGAKTVDNGVLVILAMKDRKSRIEVGKGVEGDLPDLKANDILNNVLRPRMRAGDVEGALGATFDAISTAIVDHRAEVADAKKAAAKDASRSQPSQPSCAVSTPGAESSGGGGWVVIALVGVGFLTWWYLARQTRLRRERQELAASREREKLRAKLAQDRLRADKEAKEKLERERLARALTIPTPSVPVPTFKAPVAVPAVTAPRKPTTVSAPPRQVPRPAPKPVVPAVAAAVAATAISDEYERQSRIRRERDEEDRRTREREDEARRARERQDEEDRRRRQQERDDEDRRRRQQEEDDRRRASESSYSSSSSSSSYDSGGSSGGSGGFGGGDFGGGGSSSDW